VTWPDDGGTIPLEVHAAFGADLAADPLDWTWTDLSGRLEDTPISWRAGGASETGPTTATIQLTNDDGALTPGHAGSPYWPHVILGCPVRLSLRRGWDRFNRTVAAGWGSPDAGGPWSHDGPDSGYTVAGGVGVHMHSAVDTPRTTWLSVSVADVEQVVDITVPAAPADAPAVAGVIARRDADGHYLFRVTLGPDGTVAIAIERHQDGSVDVLAEADTDLTYTAGQPLRVQAVAAGDRLVMAVWDPADDEAEPWRLQTVDPDPIATPGAVGLTSWLDPDAAGPLPYAVAFGGYVARVDLLAGYASSWQLTMVPSGDGETLSSAVRVTVAGILRRLQQGAGGAMSALAQTTVATPAVVGYWPLEDGSDTTSPQSPLPGVPAAHLRSPGSAIARPLVFGADDGLAGSRALPALQTQNTLSWLEAPLRVVPGPALGVSFWTRTERPESAEDNGIVTQVTANLIMSGATPRLMATLLSWPLGSIDAGGPEETYSLRAQAGAEDGTPLATVQHTGRLSYDWRHVMVVFAPGAGGVAVTLYLDGAAVGTGLLAGATISDATNLRLEVSTQNLLGGPEVGAISIGHPTVLSGVEPELEDVAQQLYAAGHGWAGEAAAARVARVCAERGVRVTVLDGDSDPLGPQPAGTLLEVLRDAERADMGILYEHGWGLGYRPRGARYNQTPALVVDLAEPVVHGDDIRPDQVLAPVYDDQGTRNDVTAIRPDGTSARVVDEEHAARHGVYDDTVEVNVASDVVLPSHAGWRVYLGTRGEPRYPDIPVDLIGMPGLIDAWLALRPGDRIQLVNPQPPHPPRAVDQVAVELLATITRTTWTARVVGQPARPWDVATVGSSVYRVGAAGTTTSTALLADPGDLVVAFAVSPAEPWTTDPADFPLLVALGGPDGEVCEVAEIGPVTAGEQQVTLSRRAVNGVLREWPLGTPVDVAYPAVVSL